MWCGSNGGLLSRDGCLVVGVVPKIEEFVECRARITHSFNFVNTLTEMNLLDMILSVHR